MPPKRTTRRSATPQRPTPSLRGSPAPSTPGSGRRRPPTGEDVRTALPAKFSTSYGSPMSQLPNRATLTSSINIEDAAANIFSNVSRYNREARRLLPPRESRPSSVPRILEAHDEAEEEDELSQDQQPELKNDLKSRPEPRQFAPVPQSNKADSQQESIRDSHKRGRDNDAEKQDEQERLERDAKLKQQREAQARRRAEQKRIKAEEAAHEQAEQQRQKEEQDRLARDVEERAKAEQERIAQETLARQKKAEQDRRDRLAREEAERQKAEQDKRAEQDRRERLAREEAERQKAEQDKRAEQDRRERLAREEAERQKAEQDKRAEQVRRERLATEEATRQKAEQDRRERLAREEAERQKAEKARLVKETERRGFESRTPTGLNNQRFPGDTPSTIPWQSSTRGPNVATAKFPRRYSSVRPVL
ncbi:hypothetical protein B0T17DRAFT_615354 [Bombardia bombarda]|uniref:Uncharacterized protein n=1 Tax=Bombardia bombarda TaxID=252184 RepID=A0AA39X962_9PEZI|nr:hypothetical protein B0T17DRAFT_615354 [Bombardia bombarda]